jgi:hypothetical protein
MLTFCHLWTCFDCRIGILSVGKETADVEPGTNTPEAKQIDHRAAVGTGLALISGQGGSAGHGAAKKLDIRSTLPGTGGLVGGGYYPGHNGRPTPGQSIPSP